MERLKMTSLLGIELALIIIFTSTNFLAFAWRNLIGYYAITIFTGFLAGVVIVDFERSLKLVSIAFVSSCFALILLSILPAILYGESYLNEMNVVVATIATELARTVIISFPISATVSLIGCFLGKSLQGR